MERLVFGKGRIRVSLNSQRPPTVILSVLSKPQKIGSDATGKKCNDVVELVFNNSAGLAVLVNALHRCQARLTHQSDLPLELRFGA